MFQGDVNKIKLAVTDVFIRKTLNFIFCKLDTKIIKGKDYRNFYITTFLKSAKLYIA